MHPDECCSSRMQILESVGHNLDVIPGHTISLDLQTDSLFHKEFPSPLNRDETIQIPFNQYLNSTEHFKKYFGFPYVFAVSQGRLAEAIFSQVVVRNGHYIPGSSLFPTTRIHHEQMGGIPLEAMIPESLDDQSTHPFKGNIDIEVLEQIIEQYHARWIPFICIEPCNNAIGGHPISLKNMRLVSQVARHYNIPIYLDACRLIDNALMIQEREEGYRNTPVDEIIRIFCSYADGCTMSATKDFPTSLGGFLATRNPDIFRLAQDRLALLGSGLSHSGEKTLASAMCNKDNVFNLVRKRMQLVKKLHILLGKYCQLVQPTGGHAVFLKVRDLNLNLQQDYHPGQAFLHRLYWEYGIRGSLVLNASAQQTRDVSYIRFAIPILGLCEATIEQAASQIASILEQKELIQGLKLIEHHSGLTGFLRSKYQLVVNS